MDALKQRIIDFIKQNQPVTEQQLKNGLGISLNACRQNRRLLRNAGLIYVTCGSGAFISRSDFELWLKNGGGHEKMSASARLGGRGMTSDKTAKKRVIDYLTSKNEPMCAGEIAKACKLSGKSAYRILASLYDDGTVYHDGKLKGRQYLIASEQNKHFSNSDVAYEAKVRAFVRYNPKRNGVIQAYMASPARARLMAVYGRMG